MTGPLEPARAVVLNDLDLSVPLPYDLAGWSLERPPVEEFGAYRNVLAPLFQAQTLHASSSVASYMLPYECRKAGQAGGKSFQGKWDLPPHEWRYAIVRRMKPLISASSLTEALRLSDAEIWTPLWGDDGQVMAPEHVSAVGVPWWWAPMGNAGQAFQFVSRAGSFGMPELPDLAEVAEVVELRRALDDTQYPEIARTIALFVQADSLPEDSIQKYLAYFGVIESLLTHAPISSDRVDSLTRQLKRNVLLLNNRLPDHRKLQLDMFGNASPDKVIGYLYAYRSAVAHGGDTSDAVRWFVRNHPASWGGAFDPLNLHGFVRSMTKRLLIAAMREPQLVQDLKAA